MANLAIKGHATRGREVIELLKMLGGNNKTGWRGDDESSMYFIHENENIECYNINYSTMKIFSLEEFLEKYPYKIGDSVTVKGAECFIEDLIWHDKLNCVHYKIFHKIESFINGWYSVHSLQPYKEETMEGKLISKEEMSLKIDTSQMEKRQIIFRADAPDETELVLGNNFEIKVENGKTYVVKKKSQYPKTYVECAKILNCFGAAHIDGYKCELLEKFQELLICRDAYWKIAGDWKPNWGDTFIYSIGSSYGVVGKRMVSGSGILVFPTEEMRDAFYENFKDLIELCKELL